MPVLLVLWKEYTIFSGIRLYLKNYVQRIYVYNIVYKYLIASPLLAITAAHRLSMESIEVLFPES